MRKYFGTDGARGIANIELTNEFSYKLGRAIGIFLKKSNPVVMVGKDTRLSSPMLSFSLFAGLIAEGVNVIDLGIVPTPAVSYLTFNNKMDMGIMISASHNPYEFNGIKLIGSDGYKLPDEKEEEIEQIIDNISKEEKLGDQLGVFSDGSKYVEDYKKHIKSLAKNSFSGHKVCIDAGDGVMSYFAKDIFTELGAEVISICDEGNGRIINDNSGSTSPENVARIVKENQAFLGIAYDGDADRVIFSDENGDVIDGDHVISYAASNYKKDNKLTNNGCVVTIMSNYACEEFLNKNDITLYRTKVGDKYVMEKMVAENFKIGGEQSGHIIFLDHNRMGDGLQTSVLIMDMLISNSDASSQITKIYENYPQVLVNAKVSNEFKKTYESNKNVADAMNEIKNKLPKSRIIIRPSGTEPLVRIMIEGDDLNVITEEANKLKNIMEREN